MFYTWPITHTFGGIFCTLRRAVRAGVVLAALALVTTILAPTTAGSAAAQRTTPLSMIGAATSAEPTPVLDNWHPDPSLSLPGQLYGISCPSATFCVGVGQSSAGSTILETWDGSQWDSPQPVVSGGWASVSCASTTFCAAVGVEIMSHDNWNEVADMWNGNTWSTMTLQKGCSVASSKATFPPSCDSFSSISCADDQVIDPGTGDVDGSPGTFCAAVGDQFGEVWDGHSWKGSQITENQNFTEFEAVSCSNGLIPSGGFVVQHECLAGGWETGPNYTQLAITASWTPQYGWDVNQSPLTGVMTGISCTPDIGSNAPSCALALLPQRTIACAESYCVSLWGETTMYIISGAGTTTATRYNIPPTQHLSVVSCSAPQVCVAAGYTGSSKSPHTLVMSMTGGYVALGDSYSSGEANPPFYGVDGGCDLSISSAWPDLFNATSLPLRYSAACSGATTKAITDPYNPVNYADGAPVGCATNSPTTCVDVQAPQIDVVKALMPHVITITLGGDDAQFPDMMQDCFRNNCVTDGTLHDVTTIIKTLSNKLTDLYGLIRDADPAAFLVVVGYPDILPTTWQAVSSVRCGWWLAQIEYEGLVGVTDRLNAAVKTAVQDESSAWPGHVVYVSTADAFSATERMCTPGSYVVQAANDAFTDRQYLGHPDQAGQQAIFALVEPRLLSLAHQ
jgi:hypothetical protein